jgi:glycosyltransferase involved in cell wall biosynthesis
MINNTRIKFSIIIPVYNNEQTIERAIQSCLEQTFKSFELMFSNFQKVLN